METDLPLPMPDRRILNNENNSMLNTESSAKNCIYLTNEETPNYNTQKNSDLKESKLSLISYAQIMQIEDMRQKILAYKLLSEKTMYMNSFQNNQKLKKCNLVIFGPSNAGKTSFIKSIYKALYNTCNIPSTNMSKLVVRNKTNEEKTLLFNQYQIIKESNNNTVLTICETREKFNIFNNSNNINNNNSIESNNKISEQNINNNKTLSMNPNSLLEFWGKSFDSFPKEIFREEVGYGNIRSLPHAVIFIFDGKRDKLVNKEDLLFYKKLIDISKNKGYKDVHVVLSRFDEFEKKILENNKGYNEGEILSEINKLKNIKIENVISLLGVNWSNVHFIENYHDDEQIENNATIDYNILKTLLDIINSAELFIIEKMSRTPGCYGLCSLK